MSPKRKRTTVVKRRKARARKKRQRSSLNLQPSTVRSISSIVQITAGILVLLTIVGDGGVVGEKLDLILTFFFGQYGVVLPVFLVTSGILKWTTTETTFEMKRGIGLTMCLLSFLGAMHLQAPLEQIGPMRNELAGALGFLVSSPLLIFTTRTIGYTILAAAFVIGIFISFEPDIAGMLQSLKKEKKKATTNRKKPVQEVVEYEEDEDDLLEEGAAEDEDLDTYLKEQSPELNIVRPDFAKAEKAAKKASLKNVKKKMGDIEMKDTRFSEWTFPGFDLLDDTHSELKVDDEELRKQAKQVEEKLEEFGIDVSMRDAHPGPTVTQFTLKPAEGVKLSKIESLKDDLALALAAESLRIEAPIPGKSLVGIEMPNTERTMVHLREILESPEFTESTSPLTLPMGRDVSGRAMVAQLDEMPHLLIAGATGAGKSVCMNTFLTSLLFQNAPHELKLILIDPKRVELMPYDGIPHLLTPVITESEKALQALRWAVAEMGRRLHKFSDAGARNIDEYNEKQTEEDALLPRIVIVVDELADLMMRQFRRDTETMVARIAQMARAVGMHLIIATQRPSVDVITGLIKANIPTRMSFRVVSAVDSRTILDSTGAEDLLGKGDMLYMTATTPKPVRCQSIFISGKEIERVINAVKIAGGGQLTEQIGLDEDTDEDGEDNPHSPYIDLDEDDNGGDELFFDAVQVVQSTGKASASLLQRQLKVGYARAARLLDIMEEKGLIGPSRGAKPREVYVETAAQQ